MQLSRKVIFLAIFAVIAFICLQTSVNPEIKHVLKNERSGIYIEFTTLWEFLSYPDDLHEVLIVLVDIILLFVLLQIIRIKANTTRSVLISFTLVYSINLIILFGIFRDGMIPLNGLETTFLLLMIIYYDHQTEKIKFNKNKYPLNKKRTVIVIQENIRNVRQAINISIPVVFSIGITALIFAFNYHGEVYLDPNLENYSTALYTAQRAIVTSQVINVFIYIIFLIPSLFQNISGWIKLLNNEE